MVMDFGSVISQLEAIGVYDYFLPFLLVFTILFAVLEKSKLFGKHPSGQPKSNINAIIALIIALIVIANTDIVLIMNAYLTKMALFIVIMLVIILFIGIFSGSSEKGFTGWPFIIFVILAIIFALVSLTPEFGEFFPVHWNFSEQDISLIVFLIFFIIVIAVVTKGAGKGDDGIKEFVKGLKGE